MESVRETLRSYRARSILYVPVWAELVHCLTPPQLHAREAAIGRETFAMSGLHLPDVFLPAFCCLRGTHVVFSMVSIAEQIVIEGCRGTTLDVMWIVSSGAGRRNTVQGVEGHTCT